MPTPRARTAVVVVNYASHSMLAAHFDGVADVADVVVVDSFSTHAERSAVSSLCSTRGWTLVALETNPGFGGAANEGVFVAADRGADAVVLLNPDARSDSGTIAELAASARSIGGLVAPMIERPGGAPWAPGGAVLLDRGLTRTLGVTVEDADHPWVSGACVAVTTSLWAELGGFDDRYFMYWEDIDLSFRAHRRGHPVSVRRDLVVMHEVGATQSGSGDGKSALYLRYNCRNRLLFAAANLDDADYRTWRRASVRYAWEVVRRAGYRPLLRRPVRPVASVVRGTWQGMRLARAVRRDRASQ